MAKQLIDLTTTGLAIGDLTFDWIKQLSNNASVSQTGHALTPRGNGIYVYSNPNITEDSDFRVHITADSSKKAVGYLSPADGDLARDSVCTEVRLAELDAANLPQDIADVSALVTAAAPVPFTPDASSVVVAGTETSGTFASTATDDNNRWIITDTGTGIEVTAECNLGIGRLATSLRINGFFDAGANRIVEIYIYNYTTATYDKLSASTAATEMRKNTSDKDYEFALTSANTDPSTSIGEVKIKFLSAQSNAGDTLNLDFIVTTGEASGTSSAVAVADAIANSNWGESVNHIPRFTGELFYIAGSVGDDGNSGKYPDSGLATISATVVKASAGDYLKVFAASFAEAVDLNKNGLELHGEIGASITGNGGVPLTISANDCKVDEIILTPAAGQIGLLITGNYNKISILRIKGGLISVQDTGIGNKITLVEADEYTGTGFDLQGPGARLLKCFAISSQASTRGYYLSNTAADRTIIEESTSVNNDTAGFEVVAGVTNALIADCVESATCGTRVDNGTDTAWRNHSATDHQLLQAKEATLTDIKGTGWSTNESLVQIMAATKTRLASRPFTTEHSPATTIVTGGTILSGDNDSVQTLNQVYLKIQETSMFDIVTTYTGIDEVHDRVYLTYRYFGTGSPNHKIELKIWNYTLSQWDDMLATERDLPATNEDKTIIFDIPGTLADYYDGSLPNLSAKLKIDHVSNFDSEHYFWLDTIGFGCLEVIYSAPDNAGISTINDLVSEWPVLVGARGTLVADGTEQTLYENATPSANWIADTVAIDITQMYTDTSIAVKVYYKIKAGGAYVKFDTQNYTASQVNSLNEPGIVIRGIPNRYGYKVTLHQWAGSVYKSFDWERFSKG
ncbi:hypothetical protein KAR91_36900, partial [Candidatus Pacearchaeota archaeon]|nr:hypothetical protein [Candidatus Pacearchaeota archaeon]